MLRSDSSWRLGGLAHFTSKDGAMNVGLKGLSVPAVTIPAARHRWKRQWRHPESIRVFYEKNTCKLDDSFTLSYGSNLFMIYFCFIFKIIEKYYSFSYKNTHWFWYLAKFSSVFCICVFYFSCLTFFLSQVWQSARALVWKSLGNSPAKESWNNVG